MHIASGLTLIRRNPAQSDAARVGNSRGAAWWRTSEQVTTSRAWLRTILPGAILLTALVVLGALFPLF